MYKRGTILPLPLWIPYTLRRSLSLLYPLNKIFCSCLSLSPMLNLQHQGNRDPESDSQHWYHLWSQKDGGIFVFWQFLGSF